MTTDDGAAPASAQLGAVGEKVPDAADGQWHRVHPLTPLIRSWQVVVVGIVFLAQDYGQRVARQVGGVEGGDGGPGGFRLDLGSTAFWIAAGVAAGVVALVVGLAWLSWRMRRYRLSAESLQVQSGVLSRRQRAARLDRLQAVDVVQPLVARVFGLAKLHVEVAGGSDSKIVLDYLTHDQALRLRNHLLARAAGVTYETADAPEAPEHDVHEVSLGRLVGSVLLSSVTVWLLVFAVVLVVSAVVFDTFAPIAGLAPAVLTFGSSMWGRFAGGFGFRVATSPDGLRLRHGLLEQRNQTVPPGRVQAIRLSQPLLWRLLDWWHVEVNVAGYGKDAGNGKDTESTLMPVASRSEALSVLAMVVPALTVQPGESPRAVVEAGLSGLRSAGGFVPSPRAARWVDPIGWRRNGYRVTGEVLLVKRGLLHRHLDVVPHARTQSLAVRQGPLQRRLGVASFVLHSTPGPVDPVVQHLTTTDTVTLLHEQSRRARLARAAAGPERWMERVAAPQPILEPRAASAEPGAVEQR